MNIYNIGLQKKTILLSIFEVLLNIILLHNLMCFQYYISSTNLLKPWLVDLRMICKQIQSSLSVISLGICKIGNNHIEAGFLRGTHSWLGYFIYSTHLVMYTFLKQPSYKITKLCQHVIINNNLILEYYFPDRSVLCLGKNLHRTWRFIKIYLFDQTKINNINCYTVCILY